MKIPYNKKWILFEREDYANYLFVVGTWEGYTVVPKKWGFVPGRYLGAEYIRSSCNLFATKRDFDLANKRHFQMLFTKPEKWHALHRLTELNSHKLFVFGKKVLQLSPKKMSNKQLLGYINRFHKAQIAVHDQRGPMWLLETPNLLVTDYLRKYLQEKKEQAKRIQIVPDRAFQILSTPLRKSIWTQERIALARIAAVTDPQLRKHRLLQHAKRFEWLEYGLQGRILPWQYFQKEIVAIRRRGPRQVLQSINYEIKEIQQKQRQITKKYKINPVHQRIFRIVRDSFYTRLYSKDSQFFGYYAMEPLFREAGRRGNISLEQFRFLAPREYSEMLLRGKDFSRLTTQRQQYSVHISDKSATSFWVGAQARQLMQRLKFYQPKKQTAKMSHVIGQPGYVGRVKGIVKIVNTSQEMAKFHSGNVLVSHMTNPSIVPVMKLSAAIVTDLGGITCHAAIVARELKKPCIIGTKIATKVFKDGDQVEVDANKGVVRKI